MEIFNKNLKFTGTQVNYAVLCETKLWYFSHFITMEHTSDLVKLGKQIGETSYGRKKKEFVIDQKIGLDFIQRGNKLIIHEIKKSSKMEKAHEMQLLYYIYYLKHEKGLDKIEGEINYPKERKIKKVVLTEKKEKELENLFRKIEKINSMEKPPTPVKKPICRKCSYFEFCWTKT